MRLNEIENPSDLEQKAIKDGVETTLEYNAWLLGYLTGSHDASKRFHDGIDDELAFLTDPNWTPAKVTYHTNREK